MSGVFVGLMLLTMSSLFLPANSEELIPVLIVDGFSNHDWKQTSLLTKRILEKSGRFKVDISTAPTDSAGLILWEPEFEKYAVVIQNSNNLPDTDLRWPRKVEKQLERYVENGGGLYILHSANNSFPHWIEYDKMIGLGWRQFTSGYAIQIDSNRNLIRIPPGKGKNTGHGNRFDAEIQILNLHPINKGYPAIWKTPNTEVYNYPRGAAENITILSFAYDSTATHLMWPVEWVVNYGKGRVYNSSMGHLWPGETYPESFRCVGFQTTMIRATEWLATGKVNYPVPENFPTGNAVSLRAEKDLY